ncbi:Unknown protein sequence [Pseudomonas amygdali pv. sesami]|nr:Unknown protein sequence [Pseudomonas amygdali pv. sesami]
MKTLGLAMIAGQGVERLLSIGSIAVAACNRNGLDLQLSRFLYRY